MSGEQSVRAPLDVGGIVLPHRVFLAPLSGISDVPFRQLARQLGAGYVVSEMVASAEFVRGDRESALRAMSDGAGHHVVQLAGRDPVWMKAAAERLVDLGADVIDINMGCPAKKVVGGLSGSALMRDLDLALRLVEATVAGAGRVPVTLKMRLGWDRQSLNAATLGARAEAAGVRMFAVHGRTRDQFYEGTADWEAIAAVKRAVRVPLVANGDLCEPGQERDMLRASGADAVMIGRGALGRPWLPALIGGAIGRGELAVLRLADIVLDHYEAMLEHYGERSGVRHARKHLAAYIARFAASVGAAIEEDRARVLTSSDPQAVLRTLKDLFGEASAEDAEFGASSPIARRAA